MNPYEIRRANLRARLRQESPQACGWCDLGPADCILARVKCCPDCTHTFEQMAAPPLSPAEQATVARFESAPDPWGDE